MTEANLSIDVPHRPILLPVGTIYDNYRYYILLFKFISYTATILLYIVRSRSTVERTSGVLSRNTVQTALPKGSSALWAISFHTCEQGT